MKRRGFALLAVLWVVVALAALAAGAVERARADASLTGASVAAMRSRWAAEGCLAVAQSRLDAALRSGMPFGLPRQDTLVFASGARCTVDGYDPNTRFNPDSASAERQARFDSALAACCALRGALRDSLMTGYGNGRINVNAAPAVVLATLPGLGPEAFRVIEEARTWRRPLSGLDDLVSRLSPAGRAVLLDHYAPLIGATTWRTGALVLAGRGWAPSAAAGSAIEVLVVHGGNRAAVVRRRMF